MAALTRELLRSELEAFAEQTLQNQLSRLENRLLQGLKNEMQNLLLAASSSMPSGPRLLSRGAAKPAWSEAAEPAWSRPRPPSQDRSPPQRGLVGFALQDQVQEIQASERVSGRDGQLPKVKTRSILGLGAPPPDMEDFQPLRTHIMAEEMQAIDKALQKDQQKPPEKKLRKSIARAFSKRFNKSRSNLLDIPTRSPSQQEHRMFKWSVNADAPANTPIEEFVEQNEDEKGTEQVEGEPKLKNQAPSQMFVADDEFDGHQNAQFDSESDEDHFHTSCHSCISGIVNSPLFDYTCVLFIVLNAISIGVQTDWSSEYYMKSVPQSHRVLDYSFCCVFTLELVLRLYIFRLDFFFCSDWAWNVFDALLVGMQLTEEILNLFISNMQALNFSFMRILRILRLLRIIRLFRVVRVISELRTIVSSLVGCMKSFFWTLVLLLLMIYIVGVFFTQSVSDHYANRDDQSRVSELDRYFASLSRSILSLYSAMSGGVDWESIVNPLIDISPALAVVFSLYIAFAVLAMMNIVTGVFVESALIRAKEDRDIYMVNHMRELLKSTDIDESGHVTWDEFKAQLTNPQMITLFKEIDVDINEARGLFDLLDMKDIGKITADQFVTGCLRFRGHAKSLDLSLLIHEQKRISKRNFAHIKYVESQLTYMCEAIGEVNQAIRHPC